MREKTPKKNSHGRRRKDALMVILTDPESENLKSENAVFAKVHQMDTRDFDLAVGAKNEETKQTMESCSQMGRGNDYESSFLLKKKKTTVF